MKSRYPSHPKLRTISICPTQVKLCKKNPENICSQRHKKTPSSAFWPKQHSGHAGRVGQFLSSKYRGTSSQLSRPCPPAFTGASLPRKSGGRLPTTSTGCTWSSCPHPSRSTAGHVSREQRPEDEDSKGGDGEGNAPHGLEPRVGPSPAQAQQPRQRPQRED